MLTVVPIRPRVVTNAVPPVREWQTTYRPLPLSMLASRQQVALGDRMRRIIAAAAVGVIVVLGWTAWSQPWKPAVPLLTGVSPDACYAGGESGQTGPLLPDERFGTRFRGQPVMWRDGYKARLAGGQVEVLNASGLVVATTGRLYHISAAPLDLAGINDAAPTFGAYPAAAPECGYPWDFVDCGPIGQPFAVSDAGKQWCAP